MIKASIIGHFAKGTDLAIGQTVKTMELHMEMVRTFGAKNIYTVDTNNWEKEFPRMAVGLVFAFLNTENIIFLITMRSFKRIYPLVFLLQSVFKRRIHFVAVGGDLPALLVGNPKYMKCISIVDEIYVETKSMLTEMNIINFSNVTKMNNFKLFPDHHLSESVSDHSEPYRICTFSRIDEMKGISDLIDVVNAINSDYNRCVYKLDIFGRVEPDFLYEFETIIKAQDDSIRYMGVVSSSESVQTLKDYFLLVFPTKYTTEGFPGTIIDAYAAGLPVVASRWQYCSDLIEEWETGISYDFADEKEMKKTLEMILEKPEIINKMRGNCIQRAKEYLPSRSIKVLLEKMK